MKYDISIGSIFKNEAHILEEWIDFYIVMGINHFYLVNNNSCDNFAEKLKKYENLVSLFDDNRNHSQIEIYNEIILPIAKLETKWLLIVDFDEFVFNPKGLKFINVLTNYEDFGGVSAPWIFFGSNGYKNQPSSVIESFTARKNYKNGASVNVKNFYNTKYVDHLYVHHADMINNVIISSKNRQIIDNGQDMVSEIDIINKRFDFLINHYAIQSFEFYTKIKMTRGDILNPKLDSLRSIDYFKKYDTNEIIDTMLVKIYNGLKNNKSITNFKIDGIVLCNSVNQNQINLVKNVLKLNYVCINLNNCNDLCESNKKYYCIENIDNLSPNQIRNMSIKFSNSWLIIIDNNTHNNPKLSFASKLFKNKLILTNNQLNENHNQIYSLISQLAIC